MANPSNEQRTSSLYPNPLSCSKREHQQILKQQADTLFLKLTQLEEN